MLRRTQVTDVLLEHIIHSYWGNSFNFFVKHSSVKAIASMGLVTSATFVKEIVYPGPFLLNAVCISTCTHIHTETHNLLLTASKKIVISIEAKEITWSLRLLPLLFDEFFICPHNRI